MAIEIAASGWPCAARVFVRRSAPTVVGRDVRESGRGRDADRRRRGCRSESHPARLDQVSQTV